VGATAGDIGRGLFALDQAFTPTGRPLRIASIGGGPAYELHAMRQFFGDRAPGVKLDMISLDLQPTVCLPAGHSPPPLCVPQCQTPDRAIGLSGAVDWPWPSAPAAEIEFAPIGANLV
jgi:hypothetical protein